jgi:hypothetical protein
MQMGMYPMQMPTGMPMPMRGMRMMDAQSYPQYTMGAPYEPPVVFRQLPQQAASTSSSSSSPLYPSVAGSAMQSQAAAGHSQKGSSSGHTPLDSNVHNQVEESVAVADGIANYVRSAQLTPQERQWVVQSLLPTLQFLQSKSTAAPGMHPSSGSGSINVGAHAGGSLSNGGAGVSGSSGGAR